jgi:hypothetical protein
MNSELTMEALDDVAGGDTVASAVHDGLVDHFNKGTGTGVWNGYNGDKILYASGNTVTLHPM